MQKNDRYIHRVGSITCGVVLVAAGVLYLLAVLWKMIPLSFVFHLWPAIFILLGIEILLSCVLSGDRIQYDKAAMAVMALMVLFAMFLAGVDGISNGIWHLSV